MSQNFQPGDFLIFQLESGFALLRILDIDAGSDDTVWHVEAYNEFFPDIDSADAALENGSPLSVSDKHIALTNRAFESTQVARMQNRPLTDEERSRVAAWKDRPNSEPSDRSVRLMLGLR